MTIPADAFARLHATGILLAIWSILSALEWFANRAEFVPGGMLRATTQAGRRRWWRRLMTPAGVTALTIARLAAAALLIAAPTPAMAAVGFALTAATAPTMTLGIGHYDGADKFALIVVVGGMLAAIGLAWGDARLALAGALLAGGQLTLSYAISGLSKLARAEWRSGRVLIAVMATERYGHAIGAAAARRRPVQIAFCWALMLAESLFPLALLAPPWALAAALALFATFHLATAWLMGLNTYVWAFAAAYPAVLTLGDIVRARG